MLTIIVYIILISFLIPFICDFIALIHYIIEIIYNIMNGDNMSNEKKEDIRKYYK